MLMSRVWVVGLAASLAGAAPSQAAMPNGAPALAPLAQPAQYYADQETIVVDGQDYCWADEGWNGPGWYLCGYEEEVGYGWGGGEGWNGFFAPRIAGGWGHRRHGGGFRHGFGDFQRDYRFRHQQEGAFQPHFRGGENQDGRQPRFRGGDSQGGFQPHFRGGQNQGAFQQPGGGGDPGGGRPRDGGGGWQPRGGGEHAVGGFHHGGGAPQGGGGAVVTPRGYSGGGGGGQRNPREGY